MVQKQGDFFVNESQSNLSETAAYIGRGFQFALDLLTAIDVDVDLPKINLALEQVVQGTLILRDSPEEELSKRQERVRSWTGLEPSEVEQQQFLEEERRTGPKQDNQDHYTARFIRAYFGLDANAG